jgi:hypothetical protein
MYTHPRARLRASACVLGPAILLILLSAPPAFAAQVAAFDFDGGSGAFELSADTLAPGLSAGPWSDLDGSLTPVTGNPGLALSAKSFDDGNSLWFTLSVLPGYALTLDGFNFDQRASPTGPTAWSLSIGGVGTASGSTTASFTTRSGLLGLGPVTGDVIIALSGTGASSGIGTWRIDNFSLSGEVSPVPLSSSLIFLLSSVFGLVGMRFCSAA